MSSSRIKELETLITRYQKSYYDGEGEISDAEFDALWDEFVEEITPSATVFGEFMWDAVKAEAAKVLENE